MTPHPDTVSAVLNIERELALRRAEFWAPMVNAAEWPAPADSQSRALGLRAPRQARSVRLRRLAIAGGIALGLAFPAVAGAHDHTVRTPGTTQVIANGQKHGPFVNGVSCGGDPAAYGLETAHHGPDAGTPGRADGCYQTTGGVAPGQDVENPVIR